MTGSWRLVVAVAAVFAACGGGPRDTLPAVEILELESGAPTNLADIEGPAVVNLWATWCLPCRVEIPDFEEVHRQRGDEIRFVGINIGQDRPVAAEFIAEVGATYDQFVDPTGAMSAGLGVTTMPMTILIDGDGTITERHLGQLDQAGLHTVIDEALGLSDG